MMTGTLTKPITEAFFFCPYRDRDCLGHGTGPFCRQQRLLQPLTFCFGLVLLDAF